MYQRNKIKNPTPYIIPKRVQSRQQQQRRKAEKQKAQIQERRQAQKQKKNFDQIHQIQKDLTPIVNEIEIELKKLSQEYIEKFKNNYEIMDTKVAHNTSGTRSQFSRVLQRPTDFWTTIHEISIDKKALYNIFQKLKNKLYTYRKKEEQEISKEISKQIILDKLILKRIESPKNTNIILSKYFTKKEKNIFGNDPLRNIYVNYMLFVYLIETNQIRHFVSEEFKNKIDNTFKIHREKKNLILIKDRTETFFVHKIRFHPQLFKYFLVEKNQQQHNRS